MDKIDEWPLFHFFIVALIVGFTFVIYGEYLINVDRSLGAGKGPLMSTQIVDVQSSRRRRIVEQCSAYRRQNRADVFLLRPNYFMIVDDVHKVLYCAIPKVACTTFKKLLARSLNHGDISLGSIHRHSVIESLGMHFLHKYSRKDIRLRLKTYFKFIVVRHPFDRLVSAYADKLAYPDRNVMMFPRLRQRAEFLFGNFARFDDNGHPLLSLSQFLELVATDREFCDKHWASYTRLCQPCSIKYDYVVRLESIEQDIGPVLDRLIFTGSEEKLALINRRENSQRNETNKLGQVSNLFLEFEPNIISGLLNVYKYDLELFGYTWSNVSGAGIVDV